MMVSARVFIEAVVNELLNDWHVRGNIDITDADVSRLEIFSINALRAECSWLILRQWSEVR